ncbi:MAG: hypothetical protein WDO68_28820 [Gammaproteobacteria bacterium]
MTDGVGVRIAGAFRAGPLGRMARDRAALICAGVILFIALLAVIGPMLIPYSEQALDWRHVASPPQLAKRPLARHGSPSGAICWSARCTAYASRS